MIFLSLYSSKSLMLALSRKFPNYSSVIPIHLKRSDKLLTTKIISCFWNITMLPSCYFFLVYQYNPKVIKDALKFYIYIYGLHYLKYIIFLFLVSDLCQYLQHKKSILMRNIEDDILVCIHKFVQFVNTYSITPI